MKRACERTFALDFSLDSVEAEDVWQANSDDQFGVDACMRVTFVDGSCHEVVAREVEVTRVRRASP